MAAISSTFLTLLKAGDRVFVDKIRRCQASGDGNCVDVPKDEDGHLNSHLALTARLTIMLGGEH